jgi:endonuclease V-like protein UPF0215 family
VYAQRLKVQSMSISKSGVRAIAGEAAVREQCPECLSIAEFKIEYRQIAP